MRTSSGYVFADFFLLGSIVTAVVGIVSCTIILYLPESMLPEARDHSDLPRPSTTFRSPSTHLPLTFYGRPLTFHDLQLTDHDLPLGFKGRP